MSEKKTKEQILKELLKKQKALELKIEEQDDMIRKCQLLIQHEDLYSRVIDHFPFPIAIFKQGGVLVMANQEMMECACLQADAIEAGTVNFLKDDSPDYERIKKAAADVFAGDAVLLGDLRAPLELFSDNGSLPEKSGSFQCAVFFPLFTDRGAVSHGAAMLMK